MELFNSSESLVYAALRLERDVVETDQQAIVLDIESLRFQVAKQERCLALIRYCQAQNQLAQATLAANT